MQIIACVVACRVKLFLLFLTAGLLPLIPGFGQIHIMYSLYDRRHILHLMYRIKAYTEANEK